MSTALNTMGLKRICTGCGIRFYDFNKRPITCPTCDVEFTGDVKVKSRRGRAAAEPKKDAAVKVEAVVEEEESLEEEAGVEVVSLDDAEESSTDSKDESDLGDNADDLDSIPDFEGEIDDDNSDDDATLLDNEDDE